jgi:hypothetical protein
VLLEFASTEHWIAVWDLLDKRFDLFDPVFLSYAHWQNGVSIAIEGMPESMVAEMYRKLADHFPPSEDPNQLGYHQVSLRESLGQWRESLLSHLTGRGTWEAVQQLRILSEQLPDINWLPIRVAQAEESARQLTWTPPTVNELLRLGSEKKFRLVNSPAQLHAIILESLAWLQDELQAESPAAIDLWNVTSTNRSAQATPKPETFISDVVKRFFDRDLGSLGIISNREVENRPGNEIDLFVQRMTPDRIEVLTVPCEVKGCWNEDVGSSLETQLFDRYMKEQGRSHGIYLVAFFDGDRWEQSDRKCRHKAKNHTLEEIRIELAERASTLSSEMYDVTAFVLDCRF